MGRVKPARSPPPPPPPPPAPRLPPRRLDRPRVGAVGHRHHLGVLEAQRLVAGELGPVVADLVHQTVGLRPLRLHLLDVVALLGVGVGRNTDTSTLTDKIWWNVEIGSPERKERRHQIVLSR